MTPLGTLLCLSDHNLQACGVGLSIFISIFKILDGLLFSLFITLGDKLTESTNFYPHLTQRLESEFCGSGSVLDLQCTLDSTFLYVFDVIKSIVLILLKN